MRLSDAGLRCRQTKLIYPNHRLPPWLTKAATPAIARTGITLNKQQWVAHILAV
jgi:hypothetical protein